MNAGIGNEPAVHYSSDGVRMGPTRRHLVARGAADPGIFAGFRLFPILHVLLCLLSLGARGADLEVVPDWPQLSAGESPGQVAGLGCDTRGDVWVFHRGGRKWLADPAKAGPIPEPTVYCIDGRTGRLRASWGAHTFLLPHGLFVDHRDHVWLTDVGRHQVFEYSPDGTLLRTWGIRGVGGNDAHHFNKPTDVAVLPDGSFYVADGYVNSRVVKFSAAGKFELQWGTRGNGPGQFVLPHGITVDSAGRVYVADRQNDRVQVFSSDGEWLTQFKAPAMGRPYAVRVGPDGLLYVADGGEQRKAGPHRSGVAVLDRTGRIAATFGQWGDQPGQFMMAHAITRSPTGEIYVGDITGQRVQKLRWTNPR